MLTQKYRHSGEQLNESFFSIDDKIIEPCLLDCVGQAVFGVQFDKTDDVR